MIAPPPAEGELSGVEVIDPGWAEHIGIEEFTTGADYTVVVNHHCLVQIWFRPAPSEAGGDR